MSTTVAPKDTTAHPHPEGNGHPDDANDRLRHTIEHAAHLLPAQGPITVFIHHNTLHAFEQLPFFEAVERGGRAFGCQPYLSEDRYREALSKGRIRFRDLRTVLEEDLSERAGEAVIRATTVIRTTTRFDLRLAMLHYPLPSASGEELQWLVAETDALRRIRPEVSAVIRGRLIADTRRWVMRDLRARNGSNGAWVAELFAKFRASEIESWPEATWEAFTLEALWRICCEGVRGVPDRAAPVRHSVRHRDLLVRVSGVDTDPWVHQILIRFCAAFLDQGIAQWPLPDRARGFFHAFCSVYRRAGGPPDRWLGGLAAELARLQDAGVGPLVSIRDSLAALGVGEAEWDDFLSATLLALRGWGGMIHQIEARGDRVAHPIPEGSLIEFLAIRLLLERFALAYAAREALGFTGPLSALRDELRGRLPQPPRPGVEERAFPVFQLAQVLGWSPDELHHLTPDEWAGLLREVEGFSEVERRRVFHLAYERRFRVQTLDALALHPRRTVTPRYQVVTCIDEREESFRRHLEEVAPDCETFGTAGFFAVAMYYRGAADAHYVPLCPVVIRPQHWVEERVDESAAGTHQRVRRVQRALGRAAHQAHVGTRTFAFGAVLTAGLGVLASVPLVARILFPGLTARLRRRAGQFVRPPVATRLQLERTDPTPGPENGGVGFSVEEMTRIAERVLRDIGLTQNFARLVLFLGHGSHSMNNPHESAHDCGACGGAVGGPNGRAIAQILNDPRVREGLAARGLVIPADTVFVGGLHNTCNEYVKFADTDRIPESHCKLYDEAHDAIEAALDRNAHERCRRFESAPLTISFAGARQHLDNRAEDLAQVRPEWGHATNAITIVGRRERTRGLYLDRRAFLTSYDPTQDDADATILTRTLQAVFPVCGGISLEYYFCRVDPTGYGCGTKLPHNITSLLGVMDGAASDLRTGLPWQMVEIHEPVRLLIVCETTPEVMMRILERNPMMMQMTVNGWVQLAVLDPSSQAISVFRKGKFEDYLPRATTLPRAASSVDWYRGWRDHLEFAEIELNPGATTA
ncbi:MAG TPA: DUF2309 domain-containing protein [Gemmataceae bacterium]|nr:DUF2309 domain-containing protein [Gemmataceae bacterium]